MAGKPPNMLICQITSAIWRFVAPAASACSNGQAHLRFGLRAQHGQRRNRHQQPRARVQPIGVEGFAKPHFQHIGGHGGKQLFKALHIHTFHGGRKGTGHFLPLLHHRFDHLGEIIVHC